MRIFKILLLLIFTTSSFSQEKTKDEKYPEFFGEIMENTARNIEFWDLDLYGPLLFVDGETREIYANEPDDKGVLKRVESIFKGTLPNEINIANTAIDWNGKRWAMIMLPLPENKHERLDLLSHELFHRSQPKLGFSIGNPNNDHLDMTNGRIYLRLELELLKCALDAEAKDEILKHVTNAITVRKYRNEIFPGSSSNENLLELNEGLATYTGIMMSGRNESEIKEYFEESLFSFKGFPTFVRSFAYLTTPIYGFVLSRYEKNWNKQINNDTNLTDFFISAFNISLPSEINKSVENIIKEYEGEKIVAEELNREEERNKRIAFYKSLFIDKPHLEIKLEKMSISFDPRNIIPIEGYGSVYPSLRVTDNWGILTVTNGALLGSNWDKIIVSEPLEINEDRIVGDGWILELKNHYRIEKNESNGNYSLLKK